MGASAVCIALPGSRIIHIPAQPQPSSPHRQLALSPELGLAWVFSVFKEPVLLSFDETFISETISCGPSSSQVSSGLPGC